MIDTAAPISTPAPPPRTRRAGVSGRWDSALVLLALLAVWQALAWWAGTAALASPGVAGRMGLAASPPAFGSMIISRPGIQQGPATGLGFGSPVNNIFRPRINRFSGPGGACERLANAGFFGGSSLVCQQQFQARRR